MKIFNTPFALFLMLSTGAFAAGIGTGAPVGPAAPVGAGGTVGANTGTTGTVSGTTGTGSAVGAGTGNYNNDVNPGNSSNPAVNGATHGVTNPVAPIAPQPINQ
jgi:hypothetical protein